MTDIYIYINNRSFRAQKISYAFYIKDYHDRRDNDHVGDMFKKQACTRGLQQNCTKCY